MPLPDDPTRLDEVAVAFRALGHPTRLRILEALNGQEAMSPSQLIRRMDDSGGLANVAYHTRELAALGLLTPAGSRPARGALEHFYTLSPNGRELIELAGQLST
jgi:DNA-binding transcriptional ArsR family regulator